MRILLVNYRYFVSGGPERYLFNVQDALEARGHEVIPFSIRYSKNAPSPYSRFFVPPLAGEDAVYFRDHRWTARSIWKTAERTFYSTEVEHAVSRLIEETHPDVAYVLHFMKKLSPSLLVGIKKHGLPILLRISDYLLLCPAAHFLRDNKPCTLCASGRLWPSIRYRCVHASLAASLIYASACLYHRMRKYFDLIDRFILTNSFMWEHMLAAGWPPEKLVVLPTFASSSFFADKEEPLKTTRPYILYAGQLEPHKGPDLLIRAYDRARRTMKSALPRLIIAGPTHSPFAAHCMHLVHERQLEDCVEFKGFIPSEQMPQLYRGALFSVLPMLWYENLPQALIESYASGTPVLGSRHGSLKPFIEEQVTGRTFLPGSETELADRLIDLVRNPADCVRMGHHASDYARRHFSEASHMSGLLALCDKARNTEGP